MTVTVAVTVAVAPTETWVCRLILPELGDTLGRPLFESLSFIYLNDDRLGLVRVSVAECLLVGISQVAPIEELAFSVACRPSLVHGASLHAHAAHVARIEVEAKEAAPALLEALEDRTRCECLLAVDPFAIEVEHGPVDSLVVLSGCGYSNHETFPVLNANVVLDLSLLRRGLQRGGRWLQNDAAVSRVIEGSLLFVEGLLFKGLFELEGLNLRTRESGFIGA